ncbi:hypothetical protein [Cupriavidus sp. AU9028]|uniref:hypothetical protein n=1 Tax=Cupriavidus sp. AU9028 TaxID=2871157 RepID=UPI001C97A3E6|nr:hypothetical protein [Cupriavidus sp. AU9028]MBY4895895.1 hypothetical protein [Cupriavidus sp. AU9028]
MTVKVKWTALGAAALAAALLAGCGGDGDSPAAGGGTGGGGGGEPPATPREYSLAVRPHLGAVRPGANLILVPLGDTRGPLTTKVPPTGDPVFKVPADRCGPALVALAGSTETVYFNEGTGQFETLPDTDSIRALVPDVCGTETPVSLSILDEIALHLPSAEAAAFRDAILGMRARPSVPLDPSAGVDPQTVAAIEHAKKLKDSISKLLAEKIGLQPGFHTVLPTQIADATTPLPQTTEGHVAATIRAVMRQVTEARRAALDARVNMLELQAAGLATQMDWASSGSLSDQTAQTIAQLLYGYSGVQLGFPSPSGVWDGMSLVGAPASQIVIDLPGVIRQVEVDYVPPSEARGLLEQALAAAREKQPVPNADLTMVLRTALLPALLRMEPVARLDAAVAAGEARFDCTVGTAKAGTVTIRFADADNSASLTNGDTFQLDYDRCLTQEPLSGQSLARSGRMQVEYDGRPDDAVPDLRGHVRFDMVFHDGRTPEGAESVLFRANGSWVDRAAFGAPGAIDPSVVSGGSPAVLTDDATVYLNVEGGSLMTQGVFTRLDLTPAFRATGQSGAAALHLSGMVGGVYYGTTAPLLFGSEGNALSLQQGELTYGRDYNAPPAGTLRPHASGQVRVGVTDAEQAPTERRLSWEAVVASYLAAK